jgi:superfamily II DNA or RNA helicase
MSAGDRYVAAESDRRSYVDAIVNSDASRRIIVAGPGTGKTFLFKEILKGIGRNRFQDFDGSFRS